MKKLFLVCLFTVMPLCVSAQAHHAIPQQDNINVDGIGEVEQEPDQATLAISISARQATLPEAKQLADERYRRVLAAIKEAGIAKQFVKATSLNAQPQYEWQNNKRIYKGELVSRSLSIIINDLEKVSPLMQALVENEVSTIDGLQTGFQDRKALQLKAMAAAADDAKSKAKFLAERLGRKLGSAYQISERNGDVPQVMRNEGMMMAKGFNSDAPPPAEMFGTQKVQATINVSFNLL